MVPGDTKPRSQTLKSAALDIGFDAVGICDLSGVHRNALDSWLAAGHAGTMGYMQRQADRRRSPATIVAGATRAIVTLSSYFQPNQSPSPGARVARYAWGEDYHDVIGQRLERLASKAIDLGASPEKTRAYVDAGPVPERELAQRAGLGWIAKNTMLIHPSVGSYTFIGCVLTDLDLECDVPFSTDHCGSCQACIEACPTDAFPENRVLDARRCISFLTIEYRSDFDAEQSPAIGDWVFGCDICQEVCPWNGKFALPTKEPRFTPRPNLAKPDLSTLLEQSESEFADHYNGTAFERTRRSGIQRNARAVTENINRAK